jgi:pimeloyl-ACP methyl ester carboxylesterase
MAGLRPPPREDAPSRLVARLFILVLLVLAAGVLIWAAVTNQRIALTEDTALEDTDITPFVTSGGTSLNVVREGEGSVPLVLLHDVDVTGSPLWDDVVASLDPRFDVLRVDLPGFGLSQRFPEQGTPHTVASMAVEVAEAVEEVFDVPAVIAGVGLGGEVASEIAVVEPDLVAGLLMVDVDFYRRDGWIEFVERLPFVGNAATFTFETGGPMATGRWAPNCESGGWCPSPDQVGARELAVTIVATTDSIRAFRRTPAASLVPSDLDEITAPVSYVWSQLGDVPRESVDRVQEAIPGANVDVFAEAWKAHLDNPAEVAAVIDSMAP